MSEITPLLDRRVFGVSQVDRVLALRPGTARRWILGYTRQDRSYPPVVRVEATKDELVTWGEFVETRLLAEYRDAGVSVSRMRPAIERLRERLSTRYPLALAAPFLDTDGKELVLRVQEEVGLETSLRLVVVRNGQLTLTAPADHFVHSIDFGPERREAQRIRPATKAKHVYIDPLRQFGEPVVRSVPTEVIGELVRAGDRIEMIAELYELSAEEVESAIQYELIKSSGHPQAAA